MPPSKSALDPASIRILDLLQQNAEMSVSELAEATGLSASPCWRRVNDLKETDIFCGTSEHVTPAHAFACGDVPSLLELGKNLGEEAGRDTLKFGELTAAHRGIARTHEPQQAVDAVFDADGDMGHNTDNISLRYEVK